MVSWSDMSNDVLEYVTSFLPFTDQKRFSAVCQSWRYVTKQKRYPPAPQLPWLVLDENKETKKRNFFNITEKRHYSIDIPELYGQYICGSSYGWLFTVDKRINIRLLNPFTRECFELPHFTCYEYHQPASHPEGSVPSTHYDYDEPASLPEGSVEDARGCTFKQLREEIVQKAVLSHDPNKRSWECTFRDIREIFVQRAVLSHDPKKRSDFTAMIVFGEYSVLLMWKPGERVWSAIDLHEGFRDVIYFRGKFYAVSSMAAIYAVEVGSRPKRILTVPEHDIDCEWPYLVDFKGKLLLVLRLHRDFKKPGNKFVVYEVDLKKGTYREWNDLHSHAIFVGNNSSVVIGPRKISCIRNGIYFNDMCKSYRWRYREHYSGVYNMVSRTWRRHRSKKNHVLDARNAALMWFTPNA
ncbi:hypothetical protein LUZ60_017002 [Juncus effusus]|nr:hypothetical protein LUZ60_017002 [Juncus effusus]